MLGCVIASLLLLIGLVRLWPVPDDTGAPGVIYSTRGQEVIALDEIMPTRQARRLPPPPAPVIPVVVPDDVVLDTDLEFTESLLQIELAGNDEVAVEGDVAGDAVAPSRAPDVGPKPLRFVEPEYPQAARRRRIAAEVVIEVLVDEKGRVLNARVIERFLLRDQVREPVSVLEYGLEESAVGAAMRWMFQPARENGQPVPSYKTITLSFGT